MEKIKFNNKKKYKFLKLFVTEQCNLSCPYCCFGNQHGRCTDKFTSEQKLDRYKEIFIRLNEIYKNKFKFVIRIIGGEPLLFSKLNELILFLNKLEFIEYVELYSNCTLPVPSAICENPKNIIVTSIHRTHKNDEILVLQNIKNSGFAKNTQFNILLKSGFDIKNNYERFDKLLTTIYDMGANAFPQLIQVNTEYYTQDQQDTIDYTMNFFHNFGYNYYENYCMENLNIDYIDFFKLYCSHKNTGIIRFLSSSYKIYENFELLEDFDGIELGSLEKSLEPLNNIKFDFRKIEINNMFINELLFSCYFEL